MDSNDRRVLNPEGELEPRSVRKGASGGPAGERAAVIGLIDNSKPNVAFFLDAIEQALRGLGLPRETVRVTKPRSAGPLPDLAALATRCDYVINAVAD